MSKLEVNIPPFLHENQSDILQFLASYEAFENFYDGDYTSDWLLSDIHSDVWFIKTNKTIKKLKKDLKESENPYNYTLNILWDRLLPDGTILTDELNRSFLTEIQKLCFLICEDPLNQGRTTAQNIQHYGAALLKFVAWVFLHNSRFEPRKYGLSRLSSSDIKQYCYEMVKGGYFGAMRTGQRILTKMGISLNEDRSPFDLTKQEIKKARQFLLKHNCYTKNINGQKVVDRESLSNITNISVQERMTSACSAFLRQFEPELLSVNDKVLVPIRLTTLFPSHTTPLIEDIKNQNYTKIDAERLVNCFRKGLPYGDLFKSFLPNPETIRLSEASDVISKHAKAITRTPLIPLRDNLLLINKSIDIVLNSGSDILNYLEVLLEKFENDDFYNRNRIRLKENNKSSEVLRTLPDSLKKFNVVSWSAHEEAYKEDKSNGMPFVEVVNLLISACSIMIAGMKPIRIDEMLSLKYKCLYKKEGDGYWLEHELKKSGIHGKLPETKKPIPQITAKAIRLLRRLNDLSVKWGKKPRAKEYSYLFYRLKFTQDTLSGSIIDSNTLKHYLSDFCDYVGTSIDQFGRRWYINVHELRKSFLLTLFWTFKHSSVDACQWIAGHKDPSHIDHYIESDNRGDEMTEIEAEYSRMQLNYYHENNSLHEMRNTEELYQLVCEHFNVKDFDAIDQDELLQFIELRMARGTFKIESFAIGEEDYLIPQISVGFKVVKELDNE